MSNEDAAFEAWHEAWRVSTWRPMASDPRKECPAHWNTLRKNDMRRGWDAAIAAIDKAKERPPSPKV